MGEKQHVMATCKDGPMKRWCSYRTKTTPPCTGSKPFQAGTPIWGMLPTFWAMYPADRYCVPGFKWPTSIHAPVGRRPSSPLSSYVTMIRAPRQRIISSFYGGIHDQALPDYNTTVLSKRACNPATLARIPRIGGHQTRFLGGVDNLLEFAFVGLVEEWELSVRLFHWTYGSANMSSLEMQNVRPSLRQTSPPNDTADVGGLGDCPPKSLVSHWYDEEAELGLKSNVLSMDVPRTPISDLDPEDTELYKVGAQLFYDRLEQAGLISPQTRRDRQSCLISLVS